MSIAITMTDRLNATSAVSDIIAGRIYPENQRLEDKVYPAAVYKVENVVTQLASDGPTGLVSADFIVAAIDRTYKGSSLLADAIQNTLDGKTWSDGTINVQGSFLKEDGREEDTYNEQDSQALTLFITQLTFTVWFTSL